MNKIEDVLRAVDKEISMWSTYYQSIDEVMKERYKTAKKEKDKNKIKELNESKNKIKFECEIALRTLTWVKETIEKEDD